MDARVQLYRFDLVSVVCGVKFDPTLNRRCGWSWVRHSALWLARGPQRPASVKPSRWTQ